MTAARVFEWNATDAPTFLVLGTTTATTTYVTILTEETESPDVLRQHLLTPDVIAQSLTTVMGADRSRFRPSGLKSEMPYDLAILDEAVEAIEQMLDSVPPQRRNAIIDAIDEKLLAFAALPTVQRPPENTIPLFFRVDNVGYRWQAVWHYNQNERTIDIANFGRDPTAIL